MLSLGQTSLQALAARWQQTTTIPLHLFSFPIIIMCQMFVGMLEFFYLRAITMYHTNTHRKDLIKNTLDIIKSDRSVFLIFSNRPMHSSSTTSNRKLTFLANFYTL